MLDTRNFWLVKPQDSLQEWEPILREYQTASPWPSIELPQKQDFLHTLLGTKDSAPGPDGIPYSAWRLSPEDSYPVLDQLMMKMLAGLRAAPVQVGVWQNHCRTHPVQIINLASLTSGHDGAHGHGTGDCHHRLRHRGPTEGRNDMEVARI